MTADYLPVEGTHTFCCNHATLLTCTQPILCCLFRFLVMLQEKKQMEAKHTSHKQLLLGGQA